MLNNMKSALLSILGVSLLATTVGCDGGTDDGGTGGTGPIVVGGSASTGGSSSTAGTGVVPTAGTGTGTSGSSAGGTGGDLPAGVPISPMEGWVNADTNSLMIQGAMFSYADDTSKMGLVEDFTGSNACIKGTAAKVDKMCTPVAPATDCYGTFWGAAIGLNLNQPIDPVTMEGVDPPLAFDGSAIKGFAFEVNGTTVPTRLRFKVEGPSGAEFCNTSKLPIKLGANTVMLSDLVTACWMPPAGAATAETVKSMMTKIAWQVYTVDSGTTDFDFCVSNVRVLTQ